MWPIETGRVDKLVVLHGLETSEMPGAVLEECRRVLGPGGKVLFIVPNRAGLWSRNDATPFGYGRPYSLGQLDAQLKQHGFLTEEQRTTLFQPPECAALLAQDGGGSGNARGRTIPVIATGGGFDGGGQQTGACAYRRFGCAGAQADLDPVTQAQTDPGVRAGLAPTMASSAFWRSGLRVGLLGRSQRLMATEPAIDP